MRSDSTTLPVQAVRGLTRRFLIVLGVVGAICAATAASASATHNGFTLSGSQPASPWYVSNVSGSADFAVRGISPSPHISGDRDERIVAASCTGPQVASSDFSGESYGGSDRHYHHGFSVSGDTGPFGTVVTCKAEKQSRTWSCGFFGCSVSDWETTSFPSISRTVHIDRSAPLDVLGRPARPPAAEDWHNAPTTVNFSGSDPQSGIRQCTLGAPLNGPSSTFRRFVQGSCTNNAGLTTRALYSYRYDDTPPQLDPVVPPEPVVRGSSLAIDPGATDAHSGISSASCETPDTSTAGRHSVTCSATDVATNVASVDVEYTVVGYVFSGFEAPVDDSAPNEVKAGQVVPLTFGVSDDSGPVDDLADVTVTAVGVECALGTSDDRSEERAAGNSGLQNLGEGRYRFNWKTPAAYANSCKRLELDLGDGNAHTAEFHFTR